MDSPFMVSTTPSWYVDRLAVYGGMDTLAVYGMSKNIESTNPYWYVARLAINGPGEDIPTFLALG